jgi:hypothetical protein
MGQEKGKIMSKTEENKLNDIMAVIKTSNFNRARPTSSTEYCITLAEKYKMSGYPRLFKKSN